MEVSSVEECPEWEIRDSNGFNGFTLHPLIFGPTYYLVLNCRSELHPTSSEASHPYHQVGILFRMSLGIAQHIGVNYIVLNLISP